MVCEVARDAGLYHRPWPDGRPLQVAISWLLRKTIAQAVDDILVTPHRITTCQHLLPVRRAASRCFIHAWRSWLPLVHVFVGSQSDVMPGSGSMITWRLDQGPNPGADQLARAGSDTWTFRWSWSGGDFEHMLGSNVGQRECRALNYHHHSSMNLEEQGLKECLEERSAASVRERCMSGPLIGPT